MRPDESSEKGSGNPDEPGTSPLIEARSAGRLTPVQYSSDPAQLIVAIIAPDNAPPQVPGTLLTTGIPSSVGLGLTYALQNPARAIGFATGMRFPPVAADLVAPVDGFLAQMLVLIRTARVALLGMGKDPVSRSDRIDAKVCLDRIGRWVGLAQAKRSGNPADAPLAIPQSLATDAIQLSERGARLGHHWEEENLDHSVNQEFEPFLKHLVEWAKFVGFLTDHQILDVAKSARKLGTARPLVVWARKGRRSLYRLGDAVEVALRVSAHSANEFAALPLTDGLRQALREPDHRPEWVDPGAKPGA